MLLPARRLDREYFRGNHPFGFKEAAFKVRLKKGRNRVLVKLANQDGTTWRLWAFAWRVEG